MPFNIINQGGIVDPSLSVKDGTINNAVQTVKLNDWLNNQDKDPVKDFTDWFLGNSGHGDPSGFDDSGSFDPLTGHIIDDINDGYINDIITDPTTGEQVIIPHDKDNDPIINDVINGSSSSGKEVSDTTDNLGSGAVQALLDMYKKTGDTAWLEKYLDNMIARENTASARAYETQMSNTEFSRMIADIKDAGYNPWLALQGSSGASTPSVSASGMSSVSQSSQSNQAAIQRNQATTELISRIISAVGVAAAVIISKIIFKM